jgi:type I restriction enzyme S subunit
MPKNWKTYKLGTVSELITKGTTPSTYGYKFTIEGINYIKSDSTSYDGHLDSSVFVKVSKEAHEKLKRSQLQEDDILFSIAGAYLGKSGMVKKRHLPANTNQANAIIRVDKSKVLPKFINLLLRNPSLVNYVNASSGQSAQPNLNLTDLGNLEFKIPNLKEQKQIASILSAIDNKIENNLAINKTLEDMAMALYKRWFVDFDFPVTKESHPELVSGSQTIGYKSAGGAFIDSELGLIPKGWEVKRLDEVATVNSKSIKKGKAPKVINYIDIASVKEGYIEEIKTMNLKDAPSRARRIINDGDIVWSTVRPNRKSRFLSLGNDENTIASTGFAVITPVLINFSFLYLFSCTEDFVDYLVSRATGSSYPAVTGKVFEECEILVPAKDILEKFNRIVEPLFLQSSLNSIENKSLTKLRDTLLPKLISGEVRLKAFQNQIETVIARKERQKQSHKV